MSGEREKGVNQKINCILESELSDGSKIGLLVVLLLTQCEPKCDYDRDRGHRN